MKRKKNDAKFLHRNNTNFHRFNDICISIQRFSGIAKVAKTFNAKSFRWYLRRWILCWRNKYSIVGELTTRHLVFQVGWKRYAFTTLIFNLLNKVIKLRNDQLSMLVFSMFLSIETIRKTMRKYRQERFRRDLKKIRMEEYCVTTNEELLPMNAHWY